MKNKLIAFIVCSCFLLAEETRAQSAQSKYMEAFENYESGNYQRTIQTLQEVERQLGGTNAKVLSLKAVAYNELREYRKAQLELERYFHSRPNKNDPGYDEMQSLYQEVKSVTESEYKKKNALAEQNKARELKASQDEADLQNELQFYQITKEAHTIEAYKTFLAKSTNDSLRKLAYASLTELENENKYVQKINEAFSLSGDKKLTLALTRYQEAKKLKTSAWLDEQIKETKILIALQDLQSVNNDILEERWSVAYKKLQNIREVLNAPEINEKWNLVREALAFDNALKEDNPESMRRYLSNYPKGSKKAHVEGYLFNYYLNEAYDHFKEKNIPEHAKSLAEVRKMEESEYWKEFSTAYYNELYRMGTYLTTGKMQHQVRYINQGVEYFELYSTKPGNGNAQKLKELKRKQKTWGRPNLFHVGLKTDNQFNEIGLTLGTNNNTKIGFALTGQVPIQIVKDLQETGDHFKRNNLDYMKGMAGIQFNKKILYPAWVYVGGGWTQFTRITAVPDSPEMGFISHPQIKVNTASVEAGLNIHLKPVMISAGVSGMPFLNNDQKQTLNVSGTPLFYSVGVGFGLGLQ